MASSRGHLKALDGDYAVVRPKGNQKRRDRVVLIGEEATVKRISIKGDSITLIPANKALKPVTYKADEISLIGKVIGIIRKL